MTNAVLAQQELLEHYKFAPHRKVIDSPDFSNETYNPSCGDRISMAGTLSQKTITDIGFQGTGCVLSIAAASLLTEQVLHKPVEYVQSLDSDFMKQLVGIEVGPTRLKCVMLGLEVLRKALSAA